MTDLYELSDEEFLDYFQNLPPTMALLVSTDVFIANLTTLNNFFVLLKYADPPVFDQFNAKQSLCSLRKLRWIIELVFRGCLLKNSDSIISSSLYDEDEQLYHFFTALVQQPDQTIINESTQEISKIIIILENDIANLSETEHPLANDFDIFSTRALKSIKLINDTFFAKILPNLIQS